VRVELTSSGLTVRCAAPVFMSSQCWCRTNSTEVQSLSPLREPGWKRFRASGGARTRTRPFTTYLPQNSDRDNRG
jgi:hypothetical protein